MLYVHDSLEQNFKMNLIGVGLYTFPEVSKLTNIPVQDLHRWLKGYSSKQHNIDELKVRPPLWDTELINSDIEGISFHDLLEVRFVLAFRKHGVSLQAIRYASQYARELFNHPYPFTCKRFKTDGRTIFAEAFKITGETELLDMVKKQYAFSQIIEASLYRGIEFGNDELASKWYPMARSKSVVLDPKIAFGKPIVTEGHVRTSILYDAFKAEGNERLVSKLYEVPVSAVEAAIKFEERLAA
jgi:uncharacterized protein (DUF433 family)